MLHIVMACIIHHVISCICCCICWVVCGWMMLLLWLLIWLLSQVAIASVCIASLVVGIPLAANMLWHLRVMERKSHKLIEELYFIT